MDFLLAFTFTLVSCMQWIPPHERARSVSLTTSGQFAGAGPALVNEAVPPGRACAVSVIGIPEDIAHHLYALDTLGAQLF